MTGSVVGQGADDDRRNPGLRAAIEIEPGNVAYGSGPVELLRIALENLLLGPVVELFGKMSFEEFGGLLDSVP